MTDFSRNELIWGKENQTLLRQKHVAVFGLGGVGGFALESLARAGIGQFTIVDFDMVSESNINRQIIALNSTVGQKKTDVFRTRVLDINPDVKIDCVDDFFNLNLIDSCFKTKPDYVIDAIDTMRAKIELLVYCYKNDIPVITSMGAGNRFDPTLLYIADISKLENRKDTFTRNVLYHLQQQGITSGITAVSSKEKASVIEKIKTIEHIKTKQGDTIEFNKIVPGSTPFVPAVAGYYLGWFVLNEFLK